MEITTVSQDTVFYFHRLRWMDLNLRAGEKCCGFSQRAQMRDLLGKCDSERSLPSVGRRL